MSFSQANRKEVEALLGKLTTTGDSVGRMARDVVLVLRLNPQWPEEVRSSLMAIYNGMNFQLSQLTGWEEAVASVLNTVAPQE